MIKKQWLVLCPTAMLLAFGLTQSALAASSDSQNNAVNTGNVQPTNPAQTDQNNNRNLSQDQSANGAAPNQSQNQGQTSNSNPPLDDNLNSTDGGDEN